MQAEVHYNLWGKEKTQSEKLAYSLEDLAHSRIENFNCFCLKDSVQTFTRDDFLGVNAHSCCCFS